MRVLLDECVPRGLRDEIAGHEVSTVAEAGWAGVKNGELLRRAESLRARQFAQEHLAVSDRFDPR
jgi:hypothetical protein